jgi:hypothetical protein
MLRIAYGDAWTKRRKRRHRAFERRMARECQGTRLVAAPSTNRWRCVCTPRTAAHFHRSAVSLQKQISPTRKPARALCACPGPRRAHKPTARVHACDTHRRRAAVLLQSDDVAGATKGWHGVLSREHGIVSRQGRRATRRGGGWRVCIEQRDTRAAGRGREGAPGHRSRR